MPHFGDFPSTSNWLETPELAERFCISHPPWDHLGIPQEEAENVAGMKDP